MKARRPSARLIAGLLVLSLAAAGCGGDSDSDSDADSPDTTAPAAEVLGEPNPASGDPVRVGLITEGGSEALASQSALTETGANIAVEYANEYLGGIGGRPIELFVCGNQSTPAGAQDCANQMVEEEVAAVVLPFTGQASSQVPIIVSAGIPYVTLAPGSSEEMTSPGAFGITGGYPGTLGAMAQHAKDHGIKKFAMLVIDVPAATQAAEALGGIVFKNAGVEFEIVTAPPGTPDLTPQVQTAADSGADAIGVTGDVTFCSSFLQAYQTLGLDTTKYVIAPCIDPTVIESLGSVLEGSFVATNTGEGEDVDLYAAMVDKYAPDEDIDPNPSISTGIAAGVSSVLNLTRAMSGLTGDVTPATVLAQMKAAAAVPVFLGDGATFTCDGTAIPLMPNVCSATFQMGTVTADGTVEDLELVDAAALFKV